MSVLSRTSITLEEADQYVDPSITDPEQRQASAQRIVDGVSANAAYWDHRSPIEQVAAFAQGHGQVERGPDEETPTGVDTGTVTAVEGNATDQPKTALDAGAASSESNAQNKPQPAPAPDNPVEAVAKLREQLREANIEPSA